MLRVLRLKEDFESVDRCHQRRNMFTFTKSLVSKYFISKRPAGFRRICQWQICELFEPTKATTILCDSARCT